MRVQVCNRAAHALKFLQKNFANLVLMDLVLPDQGGFELYEELKAANINVPVIFLTGEPGGGEQGPRPRAGRRRLHHEAFQLRGAHGRPHQGGPSAAPTTRRT